MIIPVIDIKSNIVVHAIGGQRDFYQPIKSVVTQSIEPIHVAKDLFDYTGSRVMYVADLDSIMQVNPKPSDAISSLVTYFPEREFWIDFGIRQAADFQKLTQLFNFLSVFTPSFSPFSSFSPFGEATGRLDQPQGYGQLEQLKDGSNVRFLLGTETISSWQEIDNIIKLVGIDRLILSVDSFGSKLLSNLGSIQDVVSGWFGRNGKRVILLDIAAVGKGKNDSISDWQNVINSNLTQDFFLGGGIRNQHDVDRWLQIGAKGVLVATALHSGQIAKQK
jgi:phosphoribosylformimino-5-aminoimidazole carboxamide ribotide isomerase